MWGKARRRLHRQLDGRTQVVACVRDKVKERREKREEGRKEESRDKRLEEQVTTIQPRVLIACLVAMQASSPTRSRRPHWTNHKPAMRPSPCLEADLSARQKANTPSTLPCWGKETTFSLAVITGRLLRCRPGDGVRRNSVQAKRNMASTEYPSTHEPWYNSMLSMIMLQYLTQASAA